MNPEFVKISQAAEFCGLSIAGYRAAMRRGRLPRPIKGMRIFSLNEIRRFLGHSIAIIPPHSGSDEAYEMAKLEINYGQRIPRRKSREKASH